MKPSLYPMLLWMLLSLHTATAQKREVLGNDQVISLTKAGMEPGIIITKIVSSSCHFDVSTTGLIGLKKAGVDAQVLQAMMDKSVPASPVAPEPPKSQLPRLDLLNLVHFYDKSSQTIRPLERASASLKTKTKFLGYGGTNMVLEIDQARSSARIRMDSVRSFIVKTGTGVDGFVLYRAEVRNNSRQGIAAKFGMGGLKGSQGVIGVDLRQLEPGVYEIIPTAALGKGEYFFAPKTAASSSTTNVDVYAFGID